MKKLLLDSEGVRADSIRDVFAKANDDIFLALSALRLGSGGALAAEYSVLLPFPLERRYHEVFARTDPPGSVPHPDVRTAKSWPSERLESVLMSADSTFRQLLRFPWEGEHPLLGGGIEYSIGILPAQNHRTESVETTNYIEFALRLFDHAYTRSLVESIIDLWALMEGLLSSESDRESFGKLAHRISLRATTLLCSNEEHTDEEQQNIYNAVRDFNEQRHSMAHGQRKSPRKPTAMVWTFRDLAGRIIRAAVERVAHLARLAVLEDVFDQPALIESLEQDMPRVLLKGQDAFWRVWRGDHTE